MKIKNIYLLFYETTLLNKRADFESTQIFFFLNNQAFLELKMSILLIIDRFYLDFSGTLIPFFMTIYYSPGY